ncbi:MAG: 50S ribosomal protein L29 [Candidatus Komeilibacteria bacterium]|nr:50S ribosomal protein L29 [Candidatus Komeilibacteria bacterium]
MEFKDLKLKSKTDLHRLLAEQREKLRELQFSVSNKQLKNVREIRQVKVMVARILTVLNKMAETPTGSAAKEVNQK